MGERIVDPDFDESLDRVTIGSYRSRQTTRSKAFRSRFDIGPTRVR
jgi:hypothetical protein